MRAPISNGPIEYWGNYITTLIEVNYEIQEVILIATISDLDTVSSATVHGPGATTSRAPLGHGACPYRILRKS
jgi:hypothetical protein